MVLETIILPLNYAPKSKKMVLSFWLFVQGVFSTFYTQFFKLKFFLFHLIRLKSMIVHTSTLRTLKLCCLFLFCHNFLLIFMSRDRDLNPGPLPYHGSALPLSYLGKSLKFNFQFLIFNFHFYFCITLLTFDMNFFPPKRDPASR